MKFEDCGQISKIAQIPKFMKIHAMGAELLHIEERIVRHDEANSHYPEFCECT